MMAGGLTMEQKQILTTVNVGASALSFAGSAFIVLCYLLFRELRKFSFKLIFYLALSDMFCSFFNILGDPGRGFFCYAQGYSTHFFCVASFLWTTTIAFTLHRTVVRHKTDVEELGAIFHLYVWGSSLVMTIIPSIGNEYGQAGAWCWVQTTARAGKVLQFVTFYAPLWGAILFNGFTYFQVIRMLNNATRARNGLFPGCFWGIPVSGLSQQQMAVVMSDRQRQVDVRADMKAMNRWGYYPLILIGSWTFATINRVHDFIKPHQKIFWLSFLDVETAALMGLFNSIAYGLNASVRRTLQEKIDLYWPDRLRKWLPAFINTKDRSYESELIPLKVPDDQRNAV